MPYDAVWLAGLCFLAVRAGHSWADAERAAHLRQVLTPYAGTARGARARAAPLGHRRRVPRAQAATAGDAEGAAGHIADADAAVRALGGDLAHLLPVAGSEPAPVGLA